MSKLLLAFFIGSVAIGQTLSEMREQKFLEQQRAWRAADKKIADWGLPKAPRVPEVPPGIVGFETWARPELALDRYRNRDGGVEVGDLVIRSGDILLLDQNAEDGVGLFTQLVEEASISSHFGIVAFLERDNRIYPAVLDVYEHGVRATPLATFLDVHAMTWSAVYRLRQPPVDWEHKLAAAASKFIAEPHVYDLTAMEDDQRFLTCTTVGLHLLRRLGIPDPKNRSVVAHGVLRKNFELLHYDIDHMLAPSDFARDDNFVRVGVLDTHQFRQSIMNQLVGAQFAVLLRTRRLNTEKFPWRFKINRWGLEQMKAGTFLGSIFLRMNGFTPVDIPRGPIDVIAFYQALDAYAEGAGSWLRKGDNGGAIWKHLDDPEFSMARVSSSPEVRETLARAFAPVYEWFYPE